MPLRIIIFGFSLRLLVAIWNGFFGPSFGAELDAQTFHLDAVLYSRNPTLDEFRIGWIYTYILGLFYYVTTDSLFLGSLLSCIAWFVSALILLRCLRIFAVERAMQNKAMLIYALLPSSIMFTAITIREPYQLLFVNLAIYAALKINFHNASRHWFTLVFATVGAGLLHGALMAFGILFFAGTILLVSVHGKKRISLVSLGVTASISAVVLWFGLSAFGHIAYSLDEGLGTAIEVYQQGLLTVDARTHYKLDVTISSLADFLVIVPIGFIQYLFEPFPWNVSTAADGVLLMENILRGWLIWKAWSAVRAAPISQRRILFFILIAYLILEAIWSVGTINWGTSVRHHLPAWGLLLLAVYAVSNKENTKNYKNKTNPAKL